MRKTKIVCTIGPASESKEVLRGLCRAGMNVARLNFSHGTHAEHKVKMDSIKEVRAEFPFPVAIMLDTKGPEYRIKTFENNKIFLKEGDSFTFTTDDVIGDQNRVSVSYEGLARDLDVGDTILLNNGLMTFKVKEISGSNILCTVIIGGELSDRKSMSFPNKVLKQVYLSEQDKKDITFGIENDIDYIACSFVSCRQDLIDVKKHLKSIGAKNVGIIAKIENQAGIDNIEDICKECDGIMLGRGDMGVEIPYEELPVVQKRLLTKCRMLGKITITATEMLESMIHNPRPTRAEISDVANAVYDGTSAVMLSGETASGKYPVEALKAMARIAEHTEKNVHYRERFFMTKYEIRESVDAVSRAACTCALDTNAKVIIACSISGKTARMVSRFRPPIDILGITTNETSWRKMTLSWGVEPFLTETYDNVEDLFYHAREIAKEHLKLQVGDAMVATAGRAKGVIKNTNLIYVDTVKEDE